MAHTMPGQGMNDISRKNMVFTTDEQQQWAVAAISIDGYTNPDLGPRPPQIPNIWVYFIQAGENGPIKIGYAQDPYTRFCSIQVGSPTEHTYLGNIPGGPELEHELHRRFQDHRIRGEWFKPVPELLAYIEANKLRRDTRWRPPAARTPIGRPVVYEATEPTTLF